MERDGVVNVLWEEGVTTPERMVLLPFVQEVIFNLNQKGIQVIVLADLSDWIPGTLEPAALEPIHARLRALIEEYGGRLADILVCPNSELSVKECRFPQTGLFQLAARKYGIPLADTYFFAGRLESMQAALAAGCRTLLVRTGRAFEAIQALRHSPKQPEAVVPDILSAYAKILG
ncbi:MAG TPA: HAD hydrolase-like protein [bacterium]|nr:HAD hydrolase-like protein [bacterium]HPP01027.1 HAD hydrolase-like protein [bacterium]